MKPSTAVLKACQIIQAHDAGEGLPSLAQVASAAGLSVSHFQRTFRKEVGLTPRQFAAGLRDERIRQALARGEPITQAFLGSGFSTASRFYAGCSKRLGMLPTQYRGGGKGCVIQMASGECSMGAFLVASTHLGVCHLSLGDDPEALVHELVDRFPRAELVGSNADFDRQVAKVVGLLENPSLSIDLPLDIRGTVFQQKVWAILAEIPPGQTLSYAQVAARLGKPSASRAVAAACAANHLAIAIPCHRVVRSDGGLSGYRWGVERKKHLLAAEGKANQAACGVADCPPGTTLEG